MGEVFEQMQPATALEWTGERLTTGAGGQVEIEHLHRYMLAREYCRGRDVLDVAAGEGYGTALLAQVARSAIGVELAEEVVSHATAQYGGGTLRYLRGDARQIPLPDAAVDVVVSFETIEHFAEHEAFMAEIRRVLRPGGLLVISSPDRDVYSKPGKEPNPFHVRELTGAEFATLLAGTFRHVGMVGQRPVLGSALISDAGAGKTVTFERRGPAQFERSDGFPRAIYLVALASDEPLPPLPDSLFIETDEIGTTLAHAAAFGPAVIALQPSRSRADAAEAALAASHREAEYLKARIAALEDERSGTGEAAAAALRTDLHEACQQRDVARAALRRAAVFAENGWAVRFEEMHRLRDEALTHATGLDRLVTELRAELAHNQHEAEHWQERYRALRGRLESVLRRAGIMHASRLLPRPARRFLLGQLTGGRP